VGIDFRIPKNCFFHSTPTISKELSSDRSEADEEEEEEEDHPLVEDGRTLRSTLQGVC